MINCIIFVMFVFASATSAIINNENNIEIRRQLNLKNKINTVFTIFIFPLISLFGRSGQ